jgi:hypothetical protein
MKEFVGWASRDGVATVPSARYAVQTAGRQTGSADAGGGTGR